MPVVKAKTRVLIADDQAVIADTLAIILNKSGFEATAVYSGETAVETALMMNPDVLISDIMMTGMTGIDAAVRIRHGAPGCRVILFSGQAASADMVFACRSEGQSFEFLEKPVHPTVLLDRLNRC